MTGGNSGALQLWSVTKKKPLFKLPSAHGKGSILAARKLLIRSPPSLSFTFTGAYSVILCPDFFGWRFERQFDPFDSNHTTMTTVSVVALQPHDQTMTTVEAPTYPLSKLHISHI